MSPELPDTRRGYSPFECVSALQKAIRRSQVRETVYWGFELWNSSYDNWAWARITEILSEDIGPADRYLPATIKALEESSKHKKKAKDSGGLEFVHALVLMATAKKSRLSDWLVMEVASDHHERFEIPDEALDRHTRRGKQMGRDWPHFLSDGAKLVDPEDAAKLQGFDTMDEYLAHLDTQSETHFATRTSLSGWTKDAGGNLPNNPWAPKGGGTPGSWLPQKRNAPQEPAQNSDGSFGQLSIKPGGER